MNDIVSREDCGCTNRQTRYDDGEWAREYETLPCAEHALAILPGPSPAASKFLAEWRAKKRTARPED